LSGTPVQSPYYNSGNCTLYAKWLTEEEALHDGSSFDRAIFADVGTYSVVIDVEGEYVYLQFTATESRYYTIYSNGDYDTYGYLYDVSQNFLQSNDDGAGNRQFQLEYFLTAGETYYVAARMYSSYMTGSFSVTIS
jgi:hypothetical protein